VKQSIESPSPFKPRHTLRRSMGKAGGRENPFASPVGKAPPTTTPATILEDDEEDVEEVEGVDLPVDDGPLMLDDDDEFQDALPAQEEEAQMGAVEDDEEEEHVEEPQPLPEKTRSGRPRKSGSSVDSSQLQHTPPVAPMASSRKRDRSTLENSRSEDASTSQSQINETGRAQKKQKGGRSSLNKVIVHQDEGDVAVDPSLIAHGDEYVAAHEDDVPDEPVEAPAPTKAKKGKKSKAPKERDPNRGMQPQSERVALNDSPSKLRDRREGSRSLSVGPISNVHLRASTPFEDAGGRTSRFGRSLTQPLKYWANEMRLYKNGETAGIVRADPFSPPKRKRPPPKKKGKKKAGRLEDIDEESDTESVLADEWEEEVGVIAGDVANWDPETQMGDPGDLVREGMFPFTPKPATSSFYANYCPQQISPSHPHPS